MAGLALDEEPCEQPSFGMNHGDLRMWMLAIRTAFNLHFASNGSMPYISRNFRIAFSRDLARTRHF
jgi:hypothetical protein